MRAPRPPPKKNCDHANPNTTSGKRIGGLGLGPNAQGFKRAEAIVHPSPCERNTKVPEFDGNNTSGCSDKRVVCARRGKTQVVTIASSMYQSSGNSPVSTPKGQERVKVGGRAATNIPQIPSPSPKSPEKLHLRGPSQKGTAKFHGSKSRGKNILRFL